MDEKTTEAQKLAVEGLKEEVNKEKNKKILLQELRKLFKNNKIFNYLGVISAILGVIGLFIAGLIFGLLALFFGTMAKGERQRFAIFGIILGIIDLVFVVGVVVFNIISGGISQENLRNIILYALIGAGYALFRGFQSKKENEKTKGQENTMK